MGSRFRRLALAAAAPFAQAQGLVARAMGVKDPVFVQTRQAAGASAREQA